MAQIRLIGPIGWWGTESDSFTRMVDSLLAQGISKAQLYICSGGGAMTDAFEIGNQLKRFSEVNCKLGAIVASSAAFLTTYCNKVTAAANTIFMIHNPGMGVEVNSLADLDRAKEVYTIYLDNLVKDLVKKSKQTKEQVMAWLEAETWMNAETAKARGFVDAIDSEEDTTVPAGLENFLKNFKHAPLNLLNALLQEAGPVGEDTNQGKNEGVQNKNQIQTMKELLKRLGLPENATEAEALAKLAVLENQAKEAGELELKNLIALGAKKGLPENAVKAMHAGSGKGTEAILNSMKDVEVKDEAEENGEGEKQVTIGQKPDTSRLADALQNRVPGAKPTNAGRENWTLSEWEAKDLPGIQNLKKTDKAAYVAIANRGVEEIYHITENMI